MVVVLGGVSILLFGPETVRTYLDLPRPDHAWRGSRPPAPLPRHYRPFAWFHQIPPLRQAIQAGLLVVAVILAVLGAADEQPSVFALGCVTVPLVAPTADTLTLVVAIPGVLVAGLSESRRGGHLSIVFGSSLAILLSVYTVRLVRDYGPTYAPDLPWEAVRTLLVLQPATIGLLGVFSLCLVRISTACNWPYTPKVLTSSHP